MLIVHISRMVIVDIHCQTVKNNIQLLEFYVQCFDTAV